MSRTASIANSRRFVSRIIGSHFGSPAPFGQAPAIPVDPKPPCCRAPAEPAVPGAKSQTTLNSGRVTRVNTSWAMRSPGRTRIPSSGSPDAHRIAVPCRNQAGALVIGVDQSDRIAEHQPVAVAKTRPRQDQPAPFGIADAESDARGDQHRRRLRLQQQGLVEAGMQVEPGGMLGAVTRKAPAGQPRVENFEFDRQGHGRFRRWLRR